MNLFDQLVTEALENKPEFTSLRVVVEKELLHHEILRILSDYNLLTDLTFIGGTCLRSCYGGIRLSEDLDFTGGHDFSRASLVAMGDILAQELFNKYGLPIQVSSPVKDKKNVDTWKIKIETRPQKKSFPAQRINIDICALPSYEKRSVLLINPYGVNMGTSGLIISAQSSQEIYADKLLAFALRPNRIKYRDVWDIFWLHGLGSKPVLALIPLKLHDRKLSQKYFLDLFIERQQMLQNTGIELEFKQEMQRFLAGDQLDKITNQPHFWQMIVNLMENLGQQVQQYLSATQ